MGTGKTYSTKYLLDSNNSSGVAGQVLSTTSTGIDWVDANTVPGSGLWLANGNNIYNSNSGNVGIGTTSPGKKLDVVSTSGTSIVQSLRNPSTSWNQYALTRYGTEGADFRYMDFGYFRGNNNEATRGLVVKSQANATLVTFLDAGNVGIGTSIGINKLDVAGNINVMGGNGSYLTFNNGDANIVINNNGTGRDLSFKTYDGSSNAERMRIDKNGNVGIGTTSPTEKLEVKSGSIFVNGEDNGIIVDSVSKRVGLMKYAGHEGVIARASTNDFGIVRCHTADIFDGSSLTYDFYVSGTGNVGIGTTGPRGKLDIVGNTDNDADFLTIQDNDTSAGSHRPSIRFRSDTAQIGQIVALDNSMRFSVGTTETSLLEIASSGNVGIGTTSPGAKLDVVGKINQTTSSGGTAASFTNSDATSGYGVAIQSEGTANTRYALILRNLDSSDVYGGVSTMTNQVGFWGIGASPTATLGSRLTVGGNASIGTSYTGTAAPSNGMIVEGNVGIGTTSPGAKLQVSGDAYVTEEFGQGVAIANKLQTYGAEFRSGGASAQIFFGRSSNNIGSGAIGADSSYVFRVWKPTDFSNPFVIEQGGNVGIGTTAPLYKLDINETTTNNLIVSRFTHNQSGVASAVQLENRAGAVNSAFDINWGLNSSGNQGTIGVVRTNLPAAGGSEMYFKTSYGEVMRIDGSGNVGIGNTSPNQSAAASSSTVVSTKAKTSGGVAITELIGLANNNNDKVGLISFISQNATSALASIKGLRYTSDTTGKLAFFTSGAEKMRIDYNGNVGIGTTSPSAKLSVIGDINFGGGNNNGIIEVSGSGDLIFKYKGSDPALTLDGGAVKTIVHNRLDALNVVNINNPSNNESILNIRDDDSSSNGHIAFENSSEVTGIVSSGTDFINFRAGDGVAITDSPMLTLLNNRIGINTTSPNSNVALDVDGRVLIKDSNGVADFYLGNYATANHFRFHTNNANTYFDMNCGNIYWRDGASTRYTFFPSTANMTVNGTITQNSDARVKENVVEISDCISKVQAMKGVYYNRTDFNTEATKVGVIAQDVEAVLPELIIESPEDGLKSVAYSELTAVLINAIKEQQEIIEDLKTRITKLEN
jgi:hypothetical protein